jgi:hypothetical protein
MHDKRKQNQPPTQHPEWETDLDRFYQEVGSPPGEHISTEADKN